MNAMLRKEMRLSALLLTYLFIAFGFMTLIPGYPILCGVFFITLGIFQSFQSAREANDIVFSALLPVAKRDVVKRKFQFAMLIELGGFALMAALTALRMTVMSGAKAYVGNALMNPSPLFLAFVLLIFTAFNLCFVGGFFRTAYKFGIPFLTFGIVTLVLIFIGEALHFFPGLGFLNTTTGERLGLQFALLAAAAVIYALGTAMSCRASMARFEKIDL